MNRIARLSTCGAVVALSILPTAGVATAAVSAPFAIAPAPFGNPNGSFDVPPIRCATVVGDRHGDVTITGGMPDRWGCMIHADVFWLNLSTGATGSTRLSDGLNGFPPEATLHTGPGQVAVVVTAPPGAAVTPGAAVVSVS